MENRQWKVKFPFPPSLISAHSFAQRWDQERPSSVMVSIPLNTVYIDHLPDEETRYQVLSVGTSVWIELDDCQSGTGLDSLFLSRWPITTPSTTPPALLAPPHH